MKFSKKLALICCAVLTMGTLTACGSTNSNQPTKHQQAIQEKDSSDQGNNQNDDQDSDEQKDNKTLEKIGRKILHQNSNIISSGHMNYDDTDLCIRLKPQYQKIFLAAEHDANRQTKVGSPNFDHPNISSTDQQAINLNKTIQNKLSNEFKSGIRSAYKHKQLAQDDINVGVLYLGMIQRQDKTNANDYSNGITENDFHPQS